jgi:hypothetical protein
VDDAMAEAASLLVEHLQQQQIRKPARIGAAPHATYRLIEPREQIIQKKRGRFLRVSRLFRCEFAS